MLAEAAFGTGQGGGAGRSMGLLSKKDVGVKAQLRSLFPSAFRAYQTLADARDASAATRAQTFACLDGNVLMMAVPGGAKSFDALVAIVISSIRTAMATSAVTVVAFDEPDALTQAKREEQMRRDAPRDATRVACSGDMQTVPLSDEYTRGEVHQSENVQLLMQNRSTRPRLIDEVCRTAMTRLQRQIDDWNAAGHTGGHVVFDGVDPRGADRHTGAARSPTLVASSEAAHAAFARDFRIGEGDLKLAHLGRSVRRLASEPSTPLLEATTLSLCVTIDTDSFAIELIEEARRAGDAVVSPVNTLLCMRERASKRGRDDDHDPYYLCCDVAMLHAQLQRHMWGVHRSPGDLEQRAAITLLVAGWAACGCDFVSEVKPMRADVVFRCIGDVVRSHPDGLGLIEHAWRGDRGRMSLVHEPVRALLLECARALSGMPRVKAQHVASLRRVDELVLRRLSWVVAYWNSVEYGGDLSDFGFCLAQASGS